MLLNQTYFVLFLIIALGFILGNIRIRGISLDASAVIFVALLFGHLGIQIPKDFQTIGLVLFIFTIGIQAGPGFFRSFIHQGSSIFVITFILVISGWLTALVLGRAIHIDRDMTSGLFTGALTSTPGLAAAIDAAKSPRASIGYGIAYPFGVLGVILFVKLLPVFTRIDFIRAGEEIKDEINRDYPEILRKNFMVENENIINKTIGALKIRSMTGANISRVLKGKTAITPDSDVFLEKGDIIRAVGTAEALEKFRLLVGSETEKEIPLGKDYEVRSILVTNKKVVNKTLAEINLWHSFHATVTRIRRSGIDIVPSPASHLRFGDKLIVASSRSQMKDIVFLLGNEDKKLSDTDFFPVAAGIVLGVLLGKISIGFTENFTFSLGLTGGVLVTGMILSSIGKTGPVIWTMSGAANQLLKQLGLLLFLATVGTHAGKHLAETFTQYGFKLFFIGMLITLIPMTIGTWVGLRFYKINPLKLLGIITGGMTSTPGLAAADSMSDSNAAQVAYATVYPFAMVLIIILVQLTGLFHF
ncbi:MAG: transporter [Chlorobi bacterium]|nr:transporter [Chlorobiota bacterium]